MKKITLTLIVILALFNYSYSQCASTTTWDGTNWDNGNPTLTTEAVLNADYDTDAAADGSFTACSLTVNATFTLTVSDDSYIEIENDILANGNINVRPKGSVVQIDDTATVTIGATGAIDVTKTTPLMNNWYEYTYWSSPVANETVGTAFAQAQPSRRFFFNAQNFEDAEAETNNDNTPINGNQDDIDDDGNDWTFANNATVMNPGEGYATTHAEALFVGPPMSAPPYQFDYIFTGPFNNGIYNVPIYRNDNTLADNNWNFIGNPYPSAISVATFLATNSAIDAAVPGPIAGAVFLWSQNTAPTNATNGNEQINFAQADYAIINGITSIKGGDEDTNGDGTIDANDNPSLFIPSGQGFFVSMSDAAAATNIGGDIWTADVVFNNSMRVTADNTQFFRNTATQNLNTIKINLTSDNGVFNQIAIAYRDSASNEFDGMYYDAPRNLSTGASSILYSIIEGNDKKFAIQGRALTSLNLDEVVPLGFYTSIEVPTVYTLSIANIEGQYLIDNDLFIKDNLQNVIHNLKESDYNFSSATGDFTDRFEIVFRNSALSIDDNQITDNDLTIIELKDGRVQFSIGKNGVIQSIDIMDITGRQIYSLSGSRNIETYNLERLVKSAFIARVTLSNGQVITKKAIKQN